ncbi:sporulation protein Spo0E [Sporosarcina sp. P16b]|uniref:aspartyl-phosphate phosphatase Spo0E family protein n=1 Tax=Sporosarcina sp. P16b TaxID=2048261 RepID=UPI000C16D856|nr:aspartyl-phosphate phosphatase Spo0E family protein [Sporosarcina sp. P16b]PIC72131.1 sporulation protein Spo0E [Sporosarcina sp. P16b]
MNKSIKKKLLMLRIEVKRIIMYKKAEFLGITHPSVVRSSQRLDSLLNRVQGIYS